MGSYEYFYPGSYSTFSPRGGYGNVMGNDKYARVSAGQLGATTSIQTSNQLSEVAKLLNQGIKNIEVSTISAETFEMIPKSHLKEINRLTKLTGSETSLHAPILDPSGFTQQGWDETNREVVERQFTNIIERAHDLDPKGNVPVTIHSSNTSGTEHMLDPEDKKKELIQKMIAVNRDTGQLTPLTRELKYYPGQVGEKGEGKISEPEDLLRSVNHTDWTNKITNLAFYKKEADEMLQGAVVDLSPAIIRSQETGEFGLNPNNPSEIRAYERMKRADLFLENVQTSFTGIFDNAYKYSDNPEVKKELKNISDEWKKFSNEAQSGKLNPISYITEKSRIIDISLQRLSDLERNQKVREKGDPYPNMFIPVEQFAKEKASKTLGNVAFNAYKKFGETAPIVSIENPPYGMTVSRAQDLKDLIKQSREVFVEQAMKEHHMSKGDAEKAAEKIIGATWDTSHIAMLRKQGFDNKKLIEEAKIIAPFVKHVHLNDNFGSTHTDLPPGMGNTPIKEVLEEFDKKGFKGKKVFEGGNFFQNFQQSPHPYVLEGLGSPIYTSGEGPTWNEAFGRYGSYFAGFGTTLPEQHFSMYGGGFSALPTELGGQIQRRGSGFSGTPME